MLIGFEGVTANTAGTAFGAFQGFPLNQFPVGAKTGTAQVDNKQDTSIFTAFAPANDPHYVVTVLEEEAGFGASGAAPVVRHVLEGLLGLPQSPIVYIPVNENASNN